MTIQTAPDHVALAERLAATAAREVRALGGWAAFETKADGSPVTDIDRAVEQALRLEIAAAAPDHGIVGEEFGAENADRDWVWILDPIDGTRQFTAGLPNFGVLIALAYRNRPVVGVIAQPLTGAVCLGVAGTEDGSGAWIDGRPVQSSAESELARSIVCLSDPDAFAGETARGFDAMRGAGLWNVYDGGCLAYAALAAGRIGVALNGPNMEPFDIAALLPVVEGAGGVVTDWTGGALDARSAGAIVASANPRLHEEALRLLA